ncbi:MAG TPA: hypothetical protein VFW58_08575 [Trichococcus sp.]|nr:hypothetical protein [Trichococcus sp.]
MNMHAGNDMKIKGDVTEGDKLTYTQNGDGAKTLVDQLSRQMALPPDQQDKGEVEQIIEHLGKVAPTVLRSLLHLWRNPLEALGIAVDALLK